MEKFSDRMGITEPPEPQLDSMNDELRNSLWNLLLHVIEGNGVENWEKALKKLFLLYFKKPTNEVPSTPRICRDWLFDRFKGMQWYEVYNFVAHFMQYVRNYSNNKYFKEDFESTVNHVLEGEFSGYRSINFEIVPITNEQEMEAVRKAVTESSSLNFGGVNEHIKKALHLLGRKPEPDYPNSIKESISAVESICKYLTDEKSGGLKSALEKLSDKISLHPSLEQGFLKLYGYTSNEDGIRHSILEAKDIGFAEAKFMLVACSAFVNFVIDKARQAKMF